MTLKFVIEKQWEHCGYRCIVLLYDDAWRCGYVGLPKDHVAYGLNYDYFTGIDVHGGLTFSSYGDDENNNPIRPGKDLWYVGFDCAHATDEIRYKTFPMNGHGLHWWTTEEVVAETNSLAEQLSKITPKQLLPYDIIDSFKDKSDEEIMKAIKKYKVAEEL